jgi:hypothetical protein
MANIPKTLVIDLADTILAGATKAVDAIPLSAFSALEYFVNTKSESPVKAKFLKVLVSKTDTEVETQVYARRGDQIDIEIDAFISGANAELRIKNNESFSLEIAATRIIT